MDVVAHNAKIMNLEAELPFCPLYSVEKECFHGITIENHLFSVCPCGNVIRGAGLENSVSPHTKLYGSRLENALVKSKEAVPKLKFWNSFDLDFPLEMLPILGSVPVIARYFPSDFKLCPRIARYFPPILSSVPRYCQIFPLRL
jgi:hypothetical protein